MNNKKEICLKRWYLGIALFLVCFWGRSITVTAADITGNMSVFDGVTLSPDGTAWTTDYMDKTAQQLPEGMIVTTGVEGSLEPLQAGEHYYQAPREDWVPVGRWQVAWSPAQCIHQFKETEFGGFETAPGICEKYYNNGWIAYCADCEEPVANMHIYATKATVEQITGMPGKSGYVYLCPHCGGLEQGVTYTHMCREKSYNRYEVQYQANPPKGQQAAGTMLPTRHMYNNAGLYEGADAGSLGYGDKRLRENGFICPGYQVTAFNTKADGSGVSYKPGQAVENLTADNNGVVVLYAQWEKVESSLVIDAGAGTYYDVSIFTITMPFGSEYYLKEEAVKAPRGHTVSFDANGGTAPREILTRRAFAAFEPVEPFGGDLKEKVYTFTADKALVDVIQVRYKEQPFVLPHSTKENFSLVGWYAQADLSEESFVGAPGESVTVTEDAVLYARWARLALNSKQDYEALGGIGAVDLSWKQADGKRKYYKLYQAREEEAFLEIFGGESMGEVPRVAENVGADRQGDQITVKHTGYYRLTATGASGGDCFGKQGGQGGQVSALYWLRAGDVLTFYSGFKGTGSAGGENGSIASGGNALTEFGSGGGGATEIYITRDEVTRALLIAGGGGGANEKFDGGAGGLSLTEIKNTQGQDADFGGGGGGAIGGRGGSYGYHTTLENPASEDIALQSEITGAFPKETVLYRSFLNESKYPGTQISEEDWQRYIQNAVITIGGLNKAWDFTGTDFSDEENHLYEEKVTTAAANRPVTWYAYQEQGGFVRKMSAVFDTNQNTNLVLSGAILNSWRYDISGNIRFRISDADSGEVLHDVTYVEGEGIVDASEDYQVYIAKAFCWGDFEVSKARRVLVEVLIYQETMSGAHTDVGILDTFFYGRRIEQAGPATGGSSYINQEYGCKKSAYKGAAHTGNGQAVIESVDIGYVEQNELADVQAKDMAPPESIASYKISLVEAFEIKVEVEKPQDRGTVYYHKAQSYSAPDQGLSLLSESNVTKDCLTTGVKGYYYYVDDLKTGEVRGDASFTESPAVYVEMTAGERYLHIAAVDKAGNISDTATIRLSLKEPVPTDPEFPKRQALFTGKLELKETEFVYQKESGIYYVKADGSTSHSLLGQGYLEKAATMDYQVDSLRFVLNDFTDFAESDEHTFMESVVPHGDLQLSQCVFENAMLQLNNRGLEGFGVLQQVAKAIRKDHGKCLQIEQCFAMEKNSQPFYVYPRAMAAFNEEEYVSDRESDIENGIRVIPDSTPPVLEGLEALEQVKVLDMTVEEATFSLQAYDVDSGLKQVQVFVENTDNHLQKTYTGDSQGQVQITIAKSDPLFAGNFKVWAVATDRVSNVGLWGQEGLSFTLEAKLYRERNPLEQVCKEGDGVVLDIKTSGYVDRVEVVLPQEFAQPDLELSQTFTYEPASFKTREQILFWVPLGTPQKEYTVLVKAYKDGALLTARPALFVVKGTVLDEFRTRIRNNG